MVGRKRLDTRIPELLTEVPICLRACEALEKWRFVGHGIDNIGPYILIIGKGFTKPNQAKTIHVPSDNYMDTVNYYLDTKHQIRYKTLFNRKKAKAVQLPGHKYHSVTHRSRHEAYEKLGPSATERELDATGEELGHSPKTRRIYYDRVLIDEAKRKRLAGV